MSINGDKVWIEIDRNNLLYNVNLFRKRIGDTVKLCAVVKANAYGHGLTEVSGIIQDAVDWLAVDSIDEAIILRE